MLSFVLLPELLRCQVAQTRVRAHIVWLRLWGAYIERRLIEIEARVTNQEPVYYTGDDFLGFDGNPLFAKLDAIEKSIRRLEYRADDPAPGALHT